ncbi:MAG: trypsin-like serine protease [Leptolyngbya sp. SIO4C5]|nr:trypsin-like serine protease [Leptolyngbya sp. SIO4C5]
MVAQEKSNTQEAVVKSFKIFSRIVQNKTITDIVCNGDNSFCQWVTNNLSESGDAAAFTDHEISLQAKIKILGARSAKIQPRFKFLSIGQPDYLPIAFLEKGLRASAPVCRISRRYALEDLIKLIGQQSVDDFPEILSPISTHLQLEESFWRKYTGKAVEIACQDSHFRQRQRYQSNPDVVVPFATGFLVGRDWLLTNHHVLSSPAVVQDCIAQFNYERDAKERSLHPVNYQFDPNFFVGNPALDYSLVKLKPLVDQTELDRYKVDYYAAGDNFGWLPMHPRADMVLPPMIASETLLAEISDEALRLRMTQADFPGEPVSLIHHPRGRQKEITLFDNRVQAVYENAIEYMTDSDLGSSGSPVLNRDWELVALHHALLVEDQFADVAPPIGKSQPPQQRPRGRIRGSAGIRIHKIVEDLGKFQVEQEPSLKGFLDEYVHYRIVRPSRVFLSFIGDLEYPKHFLKEVEAVRREPQLLTVLKRVLEQVQIRLQANGYQVFIAPSEFEDPLKVIDWINNRSYPQSSTDQDYRVGDVALQFSLRHNPEHPNLRGVSAYYIGFKSERRSHGDIVLQALTKALLDELPNRGSRADDSQSAEGLPFCRDVMMPSLVLNLGFWTNAADRSLIAAAVAQKAANSQAFEQLVAGLVNGIMAWSRSLNPMAAVLANGSAASQTVNSL